VWTEDGKRISVSGFRECLQERISFHVRTSRQL
jgi:hypothetical protein